MTKIITDVQIKKLMKQINSKREWSMGCVQALRVCIQGQINFLLNEIETNMVGTTRVQQEDIVNAHNTLANAMIVSKHPVLEHFVAEHKEILGGEEE